MIRYRRSAPAIALVGLLVCAGPLFGQTQLDRWLGPAPVMQAGAAPTLPLRALTTNAAISLPDIDNFNRYQVGHLFQQHWAAQAAVPMDWSGNVGACVAGSTSVAHRQAVIARVNLYRVLAGLPGDVGLAGGTVRGNTQAAALMFSANEALSHQPPGNWLCWTQAGADGAGQSNIAVGYGSNAAAGVNAVALYMEDGGSFNQAVGHRRWILYPPQQVMGSGSIPWASSSGRWAANALYVFGSSGPRPATPEGVAWPARGFMPDVLLPSGSKRWSLSIRNADFSNASVQMWKDGVPLPDPVIEPLQYNGQPYGAHIGDNTIVWVATAVDYGVNTPRDVVYHVRVSGISGPGAPAVVAYDVIVFDPNDPIFADGFQ